MTTKGVVAVERRGSKRWVWIYTDTGVQLESNHTYRSADAARKAARAAYPNSRVMVRERDYAPDGADGEPRSQREASLIGRLLAYALVARALWRARRR